MFNFFKKKPAEYDWVSKMPKEMANVLLNDIKTNTQACKLTDEIQDAEGPFGLSASNPVPVYGIPSNEIYLGRLRTPDGKLLKWRRIGSTSHENIEKTIDEYEIFNEFGTTIAHIYISPYHWRTSLKAPVGFRMVY
jgi:hypothetical protein